jgi:proline iminopeptidase
MRKVPTVILLHGGPGFDHSIFKPDFSVLAEVAQLVYLDHRGNGRSDRSSADRLNLETWGDDVYRFCDALEIEKPIVLGWSFGGFVALAYAIRHPDHASKLILSNTAANWNDGPVLDAFERLGGRRVRESAEAYWRTPNEKTLADYMVTCMPFYSRRAPRDLNLMNRAVANMELAQSFAASEQRSFDLRPALKQIKCPTLLLAGEDDPITPINFAEEIAARIAPSLLRFERFADAGHNLVADAPERYFGVIREFIAN